MSPVIDALEQIGEIEWYAIRPSQLATNSEAPLFPPLITFRYKGGNAEPFQQLSDCVGAFLGKVKWIVVGSNDKNLALMPELVHEIASVSRQGTLTVVQELISTNPAFVRDAVQDFPALISHLAESLSSGSHTKSNQR
jgi:hypothetical protein